MRNLLCLIPVFLLCWCLPTSPVDGQLIQIFDNGHGGVNIRVPFVHVNTDGHGGAYVRAPFVEVNGPPAWYSPRHPYRPPFQFRGHSPYDGAQFSEATFNDSTFQPSNVAPSRVPGSHLHSTPSAQPTPSGNLVPGTGSNQAAPGRDSPPDPPGMNSVLIHQGTPVDRVRVLRAMLMNHASDLDQSLARYSNAALWQEHLALPDFVKDDALWGEPELVTRPQVEQLSNTLKRFDKTSARADLHLINQFDSFRRTHRELAELTELAGRLTRGDSRDVGRLPAPVEKPDN